MQQQKKHFFIAILFLHSFLYGALSNPYMKPVIVLFDDGLEQVSSDASVFMRACMQNKSEEAIALFSSKKDYDMKIDDKIVSFKTLLCSAVDLKTRTNGLICAVCHENMILIRLMLENHEATKSTMGYDMVNGQNYIGITPLHFAVRKGNKEIVALLLKHGAKPSLVDTFSMTALHIAVCKNDAEIITMLLNAEIDASIKDIANHMTAEEYAIHFKHEAAIEAFVTFRNQKHN